MTLVAVSWSLKAPSPQFPYGYGKVESLGSLCVSGILLSGGLKIGFAAITALFEQFCPSLTATLLAWGLLSHDQDGDDGLDQVPSLNAAWVAAISILAKEWVYRASKFQYPKEC